MENNISVVIPTYNRAKMLETVLPSYLKSDLVSEVWIIDDCSTQENWRKTQSLESMDARIHCVRNEQNLGAPGTRNRGIHLSQGSHLLLSEDDLELGENQLEILMDHIQKTGADIIAGRRLWLRVGETKEQVLKRTQNKKRSTVNLRWLDVDTTATPESDIESPLLDATMLMRREVVQEVNYHVPFGGPSTWREESDFQLNALELGYKLIFCPHTICFHHARASASFGSNRLMGNIRYLSRIFSNNLLFLERHQDFLKEEYPKSLVLDSLRLTSTLYTIRKSVWLFRSEFQRWYNSRIHHAFEWK